MAKQRWATLSVVDHLDRRFLVPDILAFDRLVFPYPANQAERAFWAEKGWEPDLQNACLTRLGDIAKLFDWGEEQRRQFRSAKQALMRQAAELKAQTVSFRLQRVNDPADEKEQWQIAQQATRDTIGRIIKEENGDDCWVLPRYASLASVVADRCFERPRQRARRRTRLAVLVGQKLAVPGNADPNKAFELALDVAADPKFQRARRALNDWQEAVLLQEQSSRNDAQALADLVSDFNREVAKTAKETSSRWLFVVLKGAKEMVEVVEKPISSLAGVALESAEAGSESRDAITPGPTAVFHHTHGRVFGPAMRHPTVSGRLRAWWGRRAG